MARRPGVDRSAMHAIETSLLVGLTGGVHACVCAGICHASHNTKRQPPPFQKALGAAAF